MANSKGKVISFKITLISVLLIFEILILIILEAYKYYINLYDANPVSIEFMKILAKNFNFFYYGNLIWLIIFLISCFAIFNIYRSADRVNNFSLIIIIFIEFFMTVFLVVLILLSSTDTIDEFTGKFIQLNEKGTRILSMSIFISLKVFQTVSLCIVSFSVLKKFYLLRSLWLAVIIIISGIGTVFISVYYYKDDQNILEKNKSKHDAGIILGAAVWGGNRPSPILKERINKGFDLYKKGEIKNIVLTGGGAPGEMTEAEVAKNELLKRGVEEKYIFVENRSNSTLQQIAYINKNLYKKNNWNEVILISDNFHLFRSKQISIFFGMKVYTTASDTPLSTESDFNYSLKESFAVLYFWLFGIG
ncbi:MAG: YdcF family protein [Ignavibacteria bacterium]